jgi:RNA recognition motif-containing protein
VQICSYVAIVWNLPPSLEVPDKLKDKRQLSKKIFAGNLPFQTTEGDLRSLFAAAGEVESVRIIKDAASGRSNGFGL